MREFTSESGEDWVATVKERSGPDYKGRWFLWMVPRGGGDGLAMTDIRWNSEMSARRTLSTMSVVELRRRLRQALGRGTSMAGSAPGEE